VGSRGKWDGGEGRERGTEGKIFYQCMLDMTARMGKSIFCTLHTSPSL